MGLQRLEPGHGEPGLDGMLLDHPHRRQPAAGEDLGDHELAKPGHLEGQRYALFQHLSGCRPRMVCSSMMPSSGIAS